MKTREQGHTQETAAAKAGISERRGRDIEQGKRVQPQSLPRHWRTRNDPFDAVWETELLPLLTQTPQLTAITLLEYLQYTYPDHYPDTLHRTLQRRVKTWRALQGNEKEVIFRQTQEAGRQGLSDFTTLKRTTITLNGQLFTHLLYHFRLAFSHWSYIKVIQGGESYTALAEGLQEALHRLGGAPKEHRTDSLSAAFKNISRDAQDDITTRYQAFCEHYGMIATRNNRGKGHENGSAESAHGHLKRRIEQALLLRGSSDFTSIDAYQSFIDEVTTGANRRNAKAIHLERAALQPLPKNYATDYTELSVRVSSSSTIDVRRVTYTVPSRLQGEVLHVRLYDDRLICHLGQTPVITLTRIHSGSHNIRARQVDYRHVIDSLVKKPQAFRYSQLRDELLPDTQYRLIWFVLNKDATITPKAACKLMVGLLHLAATHDCEQALAATVLGLLDDNQPLSLTQLQAQFGKVQPTTPLPQVEITQHTLAHYNQLIPACSKEGYHA